MDKEKILLVHVRIDNSVEVKGSNGQVTLVHFHGTAESKYFNGVILPGGVDAQSQFAGDRWRLSARDVLEGTDVNGESCHIYIENNGIVENGELVTIPRILTDSPALAWLEGAKLEGKVVGEEGGICIEFTRK